MKSGTVPEHVSIVLSSTQWIITGGFDSVWQYEGDSSPQLIMFGLIQFVVGLTEGENELVIVLIVPVISGLVIATPEDELTNSPQFETVNVPEEFQTLTSLETAL